jgi:hypothetical protein
MCLYVLCCPCSDWLAAAATVFVCRSKLDPMCIERTMKSTRCCGAMMAECSLRWRPQQSSFVQQYSPNLMTIPCTFAANDRLKLT